MEHPSPDILEHCTFETLVCMEPDELSPGNENITSLPKRETPPRDVSRNNNFGSLDTRENFNQLEQNLLNVQNISNLGYTTPVRMVEFGRDPFGNHPMRLLMQEDEAEKYNREKIQSHLLALEHASVCFSLNCMEPECNKMKAFIQHYSNCTHGEQCTLCQRFSNLIRLHSSLCKQGIGHCPVLLCSHYKVVNLNEIKKKRRT